MNKLLLTALGLISISTFAQAVENTPTVTIGGFIDTQAGVRSQRASYDINDSNQKLNNKAITNDTKFDVKVENKTSSGLKYGGYIRLNADTSINAAGDDDFIADRTLLFAETAYGRLEAGAYDSASRQMMTSAQNIAVGAFGINGYMPKWAGINGTEFIKWPELMTNCDCISFGNKVTYLTPKYKGFNAGVSYTPDIGVQGTVSKLNATSKNEDLNFRQIVDWGLNYENKFNEVNYKLGFIGQTGKAKSLTVQRKDLRSWELGAIVSYKGFSIAGSYSDWGKSGTPVVRDAGKKYGAKFWTAGAAYEQNQFRTSLTYMKGYRANAFSKDVPATTVTHVPGYNKTEYISLGADYKMAPGFRPYVEINHFETKRSASDSKGRLGNKGEVYLIGTRISF